MNVISFASHAAAACAGILLWRWRLLWQPKSGLDRVLSAKGSRNVAKEYLNLLLERDVHATLCILSPDMVAAIVGKDDVENIAKTMMKPIVDRTQCLFARQANLWYAHSRWQEEESAQKATIRHFALFAAAAHHVDGFVFHVDTGCETPSIQHHARAVATVVSFLR